VTVDTVLNHPMLDSVMGKVREVVHLAAVVGVKRVLEEPVTTITTNVRGTEIILDLCHRHRTKLFVASTSEIYGKGGEQLDEDHDRVMGSVRNWRWAYACTKEMDEFLAVAYHAEHQLPVIIGRLFNTVGPRQTGQWGMVLPTFVRQALAGEPLTVHGDGEQRRCFCHVADTVDAIMRLMASPEAIGDIFNIGVEQEITMNDLAKRVKERTGSRSEIRLVPYEVAFGAGFEDMERRQPVIRKIHRVVGWKPTRSLDAIIDETIAYHRAAGLGA
jgi:UDP-glucose 4-epimerase